MTATDTATDTDAAIATAYSATGAAWRDGPAVIYDRLADVLIAHSPVAVCGAAVVDIGAGTGAASRAATRAGAASVAAVDNAGGMLAVDRDQRPPATVAVALQLPLRTASFDIAAAAFSFNHVDDPGAAFAEAARVVRPGGAVIASVYAADDGHPAKLAVEQALRRHGWSPERWTVAMTADRAPRLATVAGCHAALRDAPGSVEVAAIRVDFADLSPRQLVAWRLGMAQHAPFVARLSADQRTAVERDALESLGDGAPPLVRSIIVVTLRP